MKKKSINNVYKYDFKNNKFITNNSLQKKLIFLLSIISISLSIYFMDFIPNKQKTTEVNLENKSISQPSEKLILPGIMATAQTDFTSDLNKIEFSIDYGKNKFTHDYNRLSLNTDFFIEKGQGSVAFEIININEEKNTVKIKTTFYMWGAVSKELFYKTIYAGQLCEGSIVRQEKTDDKISCNGVIGDAMTITFDLELYKPVKFRLDFEKNIITANYYDNEGVINSIGLFRIRSDEKIKKIITNTLHFTGSIADCNEIKPINFKIFDLRNNGKKGDSFSHQKEINFECHNQIINQTSKKEIILGSY
jgi:hypothetical protein